MILYMDIMYLDNISSVYPFSSSCPLPCPCCNDDQFGLVPATTAIVSLGAVLPCHVQQTAFLSYLPNLWLLLSIHSLFQHVLWAWRMQGVTDARLAVSMPHHFSNFRSQHELLPVGYLSNIWSPVNPLQNYSPFKYHKFLQDHGVTEMPLKMVLGLAPTPVPGVLTHIGMEETEHDHCII